MRIVAITDSLGSGGAQRQLCLLASELQKLGHGVSVLTYSSVRTGSADFFLPWLQAHEIPHERVCAPLRGMRPGVLRSALKACEPDAVLAFQTAPSFYAELAGASGRRWGLVVSERSAIPGSHRGWRPLLRLLHVLADEVTTNSNAGQQIIAQSWPRLFRKNVSVIYNAVDLTHFHPSSTHDSPLDGESLRLLVLASYKTAKNIGAVLDAMRLIPDNMPVHLRWYGAIESNESIFRKARAFVAANDLGWRVSLLPPTADAREAYWASDAVLLASEVEGCPNVVCEAMACGRLVLASNVADNAYIVQHGATGLVFDPHSPRAIAEAIAQVARLSPEARAAMGAEGRRRAEKLFEPTECARRYEALLASAAQSRKTFRTRMDGQSPP